MISFFPEIMISCSLRIIDANFNRALESLRVMEYIARHNHNDCTISHRLKTILHDLREEGKSLRLKFLSPRNSKHDVCAIEREDLDTKLARYAHNELINVVAAKANRAE